MRVEDEALSRIRVCHTLAYLGDGMKYRSGGASPRKEPIPVFLEKGMSSDPSAFGKAPFLQDAPIQGIVIPWFTVMQDMVAEPAGQSAGNILE